MAPTYDEYLRLANRQSKARFVHTNLHVHTPASHDWSEHQRPSDTPIVTPEQFLEALCGTSLELVGITDHNTTAWCEPLITLAKEWRASGRTDVVILPGVEITTYEGPHVIALFDEDADLGKVDMLLRRIGIRGDRTPDDRTDDRSPLNEVIRLVDETGGIVVGAHVHTADGIFGRRQFKGRNDVLNNSLLRILAAPSGEIKVVYEGERRRLLYSRMDSDLITNSFGFINVSDCHRVADLELDTTWIKMEHPSLDGVRQIVYEPELRVCGEIRDSGSGHPNSQVLHFRKPSPVDHPHLTGMVVEGGTLDGTSISFSPHLNCIIGRNYAGKSALLDGIRFALATDETTPQQPATLASRMLGIYGPSAIVRLYLANGASDVYCSERVVVGTEKALHGGPKLFKLVQRSFVSIASTPANPILAAETYSQGMVGEIKRNANLHMTLVDQIANANDARSDTFDAVDPASHSAKYVSICSKILATIGEVATLDAIAARIPALEDDIRSIEPLIGHMPLNGIAEAYRNGIGALEGIMSRLELFSDKQNQMSEMLGAGIEEVFDVINVDVINRGDNLEVDWNASMPSEPSFPDPFVFVDESLAPVSADTAEQEVDGVAGEGAPSGSGRLEEANEEIYFLLHRAEAITASAFDTAGRLVGMVSHGLATAKAELDNVRAQLESTLARYETQIQSISRRANVDLANAQNLLDQKNAELRQAKVALSSLPKVRQTLERHRSDRQQLLRDWRAAKARLVAMRMASVNGLNKLCIDRVRVRFVENGSRASYRACLESLTSVDRYSQSRALHKKSEVIDKVVAALLPSELVDILGRDNAETELMSRMDITGAASHHLSMALGREQSRMELEGCVCDDAVVIEFQREGETAFTPVESNLSGGEQALALLSLAMTPKPMPLIIDQPEDELGPGLITRELVNQIRDVKLTRQLLFVTHVPNIPVLADSEQIIYVEQSRENQRKRCRVRFEGSLDNANIVERLLDLDGGVQAFKKRAERYSSILTRTSSSI